MLIRQGLICVRRLRLWRAEPVQAHLGGFGCGLAGGQVRGPDGGRSAEGSAGVVDVELALGLADDLSGLGDLGQVGDFEQAETLAATHPAVGGGGVEPPAIAATRAFGDDMHPITSTYHVTR